MGFACDNPRKHNRVISLILNMSDQSKPTIIVPARLASVRFPKKLLAEIHGKPLILHTADRLRSEVPEFDLFFAVDGEPTVPAFGPSLPAAKRIVRPSTPL